MIYRIHVLKCVTDSINHITQLTNIVKKWQRILKTILKIHSRDWSYHNLNISENLFAPTLFPPLSITYQVSEYIKFQEPDPILIIASIFNRILSMYLYSISFNPQNNSLRWVVVLISIYSWGNWGLWSVKESLHNFKSVSVGSRIQT